MAGSHNYDLFWIFHYMHFMIFNILQFSKFEQFVFPLELSTIKYLSNQALHNAITIKL